MVKSFPLSALGRVLGAGALALALSLAPQGAQAQEPAAMISVTGHGEASGAPDVAYVSAGVRMTADSASGALEANARAMNAVFKALDGLGIAPEKRQTSGFSLGPVYRWRRNSFNENEQELDGYQTMNIVTVTLDDPERVGEALDALVSAGANEAGEVRFEIKDRAAMLEAARRAAVADAQARAQTYADAAGVSLGALVEISEKVDGPGRLDHFARGAAVMESAAAAPTPIAAGVKEISVDIIMRWRIGE